MKVMSIISLCLFAFGCKPASHKVTFDFKIESTNGKQPLAVECYNFKELEEYLAAQNKAFMEGKASSVVLKPVARYESSGEPAHDLKFTLDLPEDAVTCGMSPISFVTVRIGEKSGQVFKPVGDSVIKVSYNMYTKNLYKADSTGAKIEIIK